MLKYLQDRVNKATKDFDSLPAEQRSGAAAAATTQGLSQKQARVRDLMRRLAVKMGKENDAEEGR